jgi:hypothetical protein
MHMYKEYHIFTGVLRIDVTKRKKANFIFDKNVTKQ